MKILMLAAAALLLGGCVMYPGYQYADGYYRGQAEYNDAYPPNVYGFDAYGWPARSALYGGGYEGYGYGARVIYNRDRDWDHRRHGRRHHDRRSEHAHRGHRDDQRHHHSRAPARRHESHARARPHRSYPDSKNDWRRKRRRWQH